VDPAPPHARSDAARATHMQLFSACAGSRSSRGGMWHTKRISSARRWQLTGSGAAVRIRTGGGVDTVNSSRFTKAVVLPRHLESTSYKVQYT
jgi:hypothetical protein